MDKYGVNTDEAKSKHAAAGECPHCGGKLDTNCSPVKCPDCGHEPFETRRNDAPRTSRR